MNCKKMITTLTSLFICINSINFTTFAEIDLTHTFVEERGLQENTWINLNCKSSSPACKKYLIRYEDAEKLEKILKELIKENKTNDDLIKILQKSGILIISLVGIGTGFYLAPWTTFAITSTATLTEPIICKVYKGVVDPTMDIVGFIPKLLVKVAICIKNWWYKNKSINEPSKGFVGNAMDTMCGDRMRENFNDGVLEGTRKLIFGEINSTDVSIKNEKRATLISAINMFYNQINNKHWKGNDVIVLSTDFTPGKSEVKIKFDKTWASIKYEILLEEYFKNIHL